MAIYHLSVKTVSRSAGRSATAAAAYRAGERIVDERTGEVHDYTRKRGIMHTEIVLPEGAPEWARDRSALWNAAEQAETRKNSTVAREFEVALPAELTAAQRNRLAVELARELAERHGCAVDVSIHAPDKGGDNRNHHAHILCTTRRLGPEGFTEKTRELDDRKTGEVDRWRERWADLQNERMQERGIEARVDHRSLEAQGIDREPTRHLGPAATGYERRTGEPSDRRIAHELEAAERLSRAKETGDLERQAAQVDRSIIDTQTELAAAIAERDRQRHEREAMEWLAQFRAERERERQAATEPRSDDAQRLEEAKAEGERQRAQEVAERATARERAELDAYLARRNEVGRDAGFELREARAGETVVGRIKGIKTLDGEKYLVIDAGPNRDRTAQQHVLVRDTDDGRLRLGSRYKAVAREDGSMERDPSMMERGRDRGRGGLER